MSPARLSRLVLVTFAVALATVIAAPSVACAATGTVRGTVTDAADGAPIEGVFVQLWEWDEWAEEWWEGEYATFTGPDGRYVLTGVPAGTYKISFADYETNLYLPEFHDDIAYDPYDPWSAAASADSIVLGAGQVQIVDCALDGLQPAFEGVVLDGKTGTPLAEALVTAYSINGPTLELNEVAWTTSLDDGSYVVAGLPPGHYSIGAWTDGYYSSFAPANPDRCGYPEFLVAGTWKYTGLTIGGLTVKIWPEEVFRIAEADRFDTAVAIAYEQFTDPEYDEIYFDGVRHVILASGEDRAAADPLAASGLCWAYQDTDPRSPNLGKNAPLLLTPSTRVPESVLDCITEIGATNGYDKVTVHVVGGPVSVPAARLKEIAAYAAEYGVTVEFDRLLSTGSRYDTAQAIASRMKQRASADASDALEPPSTMFVANGADPSKFMDALAVSPIAAAKGFPITLCSYGQMPSQTLAVKQALGLDDFDVWVVGGERSISLMNQVRIADPANRLSGSDRYAASTNVAEFAIAQGWLEAPPSGAGVAATLPDALAGGAMLGDRDWPLLLTPPRRENLNDGTYMWFFRYARPISRAYVFGGGASLWGFPEIQLRLVLSGD